MSFSFDGFGVAGCRSPWGRLLLGRLLLGRGGAGMALLFAVLLLGACESREERAEAHYQRAVALLSQGDPDRALVELRNVFRLDAAHSAARLQFARLLRDRGDTAGALTQFRELVEHDRSSLEGHLEMAELALRLQEFDTAKEGVDRAFLLAPDNPQVRALKATLAYRDGERATAVALAEAVAAEAPGNVAAAMVLAADRMQAQDYDGALILLDRALVATPGDQALHFTRLAALESAGRKAELGAELQTLSKLFPEDPGIRQAVVKWYLMQDDPAAAEAVLRDAAARAAGSPAEAEAQLLVVQFLYETQGPEAAQAELARLIAADKTVADTVPFRKALAGLDFTQGRQRQAIAALRDLTEGAPPSDAVRDMQVMLAAMLGATGDAAGRDALLASVLEADPTLVAALKLRAQAAIDADAPESAIADLRQALIQAPQDPGILTLLALAHEREGTRVLAGENLALAVEASHYGAGESLRYARFLMQDGRVGPAEGVVTDALRRDPENLALLSLLGQIHLERHDWPRVRQVAGLLRGIGTPAAVATANELDLASFGGERRGADVEALLQDLAAGEDAGGQGTAQGGGQAIGATARLVETKVKAGEIAAAQALVAEALASAPSDPQLRMLQAGLQAVTGDTAAAEAAYRGLIAENAAWVQPHRALVTLYTSQGDTAAAAAALDAGLTATGRDPALVFVAASFRESQGDFAGAIAAYEELYAQDSANPVIANNLASLITAQGTDPASLERAYRIARRLQGSKLPQFQDTYGWILYLRGDPAAALGYLEPAAAALSDDALVQFHLAEARYAKGDPAGAKAAFDRALALPDLPPAQAATARTRLAALAATSNLAPNLAPDLAAPPPAVP